jgi:hypothetical protein
MPLPEAEGIDPAAPTQRVQQLGGFHPRKEQYLRYRSLGSIFWAPVASVVDPDSV